MKNENSLSLRQLHKELVKKYGKIDFKTLLRRVKEGVIVPDFVITHHGKVTKYYFSAESVDRIASAIFVKTFENKNKKEVKQTDPKKFDYIEYIQKLSSNS
jgi:hypothetical protein